MVYKRAFIRQVFDCLTPAICFLCHCRVPEQSILCAGCRADLPGTSNAFGHAGTDAVAGPMLIDQTITACRYEFPIKELIHQLKYGRKVIVAKELGQLLASNIMKVSATLPDCILPVPLHRIRYLNRGFNQALEISRAASKMLGLPIETDLISRTRRTLPQFALAPSERKRNLRGAFRLNSVPAYDHIAVLDDVITSGATISAIASLLKKAGVRRVDAWVCARAER